MVVKKEKRRKKKEERRRKNVINKLPMTPTNNCIEITSFAFSIVQNDIDTSLVLYSYKYVNLFLYIDIVPFLNSKDRLKEKKMKKKKKFKCDLI